MTVAGTSQSVSQNVGPKIRQPSAKQQVKLKSRIDICGSLYRRGGGEYTGQKQAQQRKICEKEETHIQVDQCPHQHSQH